MRGVGNRNRPAPRQYRTDAVISAPAADSNCPPIEASLQRVSVHGGHSSDYCNHASDSLDRIVQAYWEQGFSWIGITEHMPPVSDFFLYPDEREAGLTASVMEERFAGYVEHCRRLQSEYRDRMTIYVGMETEAYTGSLEHAAALRDRFQLDYIVGSVHHVWDIPIDWSASEYARAAEYAGSIEDLYADYFDLQYDMLLTLRPSVAGHMDLIRIYDPDYTKRLRLPKIRRRILRNLQTMQRQQTILEVNVRALAKGAIEPYVSREILEMARDLAVSVAPGDDSHGVDTVGRFLEEGMGRIQSLGFSTNWPRPSIRRR